MTVFAAHLPEMFAALAIAAVALIISVGIVPVVRVVRVVQRAPSRRRGR